METIGLRVKNESLKDELNLACSEALIEWGEQQQLDIAIEELLELVHAILKYKRDRKENYCNLQEEIVDVLIMIVQLGSITDLDGLDYWFEKKFKQLRNRLDESYIQHNQEWKIPKKD